MKKLLIVILVHGSVCSFGQFSFGIKGGVNFNNIAIKDVPDGAGELYERNIGFHLGMYGMLKMTEKTFFIPEIQFSQRGANYHGRDTRANVNYIEIPLLLSYAPVKKLNVDIGPNVAFRISTDEECFCDDFNGFDVGVTGGIRFSLSEKVSVIARYYMGLTSMGTFYFEGQVDQGLGESEGYNRNGQLGLSFKLK